MFFDIITEKIQYVYSFMKNISRETKSHLTMS